MAARNQKIDLNDPRISPVSRTDILTRVLIDERRNVLFVGEGDFSFTVAFAALRHSRRSRRAQKAWDGIVATCYDDVSIPTFTSAKRNCLQDYHCADVANLNTPPRGTWVPGVDACHIPREITDELQPFVIWFQCPWVPGETTFYLIRGYLRSAWYKSQPGGYVCIGITKHGRYVDGYDLKKILGGKNRWSCRDSREIKENYQFCGADDTLVGSVLEYGYHHRGNTDIHDYIRDDHVTLVFRKKN